MNHFDPATLVRKNQESIESPRILVESSAMGEQKLKTVNKSMLVSKQKKNRKHPIWRCVQTPCGQDLRYALRWAPCRHRRQSYPFGDCNNLKNWVWVCVALCRHVNFEILQNNNHGENAVGKTSRNAVWPNPPCCLYGIRISQASTR